MEIVKVDQIPPNSILIADDSKQIVELHTKYAQMACQGIAVQTAYDGQTAWRLFQESPTAIAMLDIEMPGLDGVQLAEKIHRHSPATGIIVFSGNLTQGFMLKFASIDVDFAKKPASQYDVAVKVRTALQQFEKEVELQKLRACARLTSVLNSKLLPLSTITFLLDLAEDIKCIEKVSYLRQAMEGNLKTPKNLSGANNDPNGKLRTSLSNKISGLDDEAFAFIQDLIKNPKNIAQIDLCRRVLDPPTPEIGRAINNCLYPEKR